MKKLLFALFTLFLMVSCSGKADSEKAQQDSVNNVADTSQVQNEPVAQETAKLNTDTVAVKEAKKEKNEFLDKIPNPKKLKISSMKKHLTSLGFSGKTSEDGEVYEGKYSLSFKDKSCKISYYADECNTEIITTINNDAEALTDFYNKARKLVYKKPGEYCEVKKKGNTVTILYGYNL